MVRRARNRIEMEWVDGILLMGICVLTWDDMLIIGLASSSLRLGPRSCFATPFGYRGSFISQVTNIDRDIDIDITALAARSDGVFRPVRWFGYILCKYYS
jgi:hypothetical protein